MGPMGRWWKNADVVQKLGLTDEQVQRIEKIFQDHRLRLIDVRANLERAEVTLQPMIESDSPDEAAVMKQIDKVAAQRAELDKSQRPDVVRHSPRADTRAVEETAGASATRPHSHGHPWRTAHGRRPQRRRSGTGRRSRSRRYAAGGREPAAGLGGNHLRIRRNNLEKREAPGPPPGPGAPFTVVANAVLRLARS